MTLNRRAFFFGGCAVALTVSSSSYAASPIRMHVVKGRGCGCCTMWTEILSADGFDVTDEEMLPGDLARLKIQKGIPSTLASCHTAEVDGYVIEGHVPGADIRRLLAERPDAVGLSVPGMPYGSPGMGPESEREAYDVVLILRDGTSRIFTSYGPGSSAG